MAREPTSEVRRLPGREPGVRPLGEMRRGLVALVAAALLLEAATPVAALAAVAEASDALPALPEL